ncbi:hypothetical protein EI94DRAFT_1714263 [Lactarius quietus]|nr:hypothetical protein EI94DRAFT_1714263 [Lactarius quietus]
MLVRAKSVPLYFGAKFSSRRRDDARFSMFQKEVQARIPHIYHLSISAELFHLHSILEGLVSPAPTLEYLSLFSRGGYRGGTITEKQFVPDALFNGSAPRLSCLNLRNYNISWKSPLLNGLKYLEILTLSENARPELEVWLGALDKMPQLKMLTLHSASPVAPPVPFDVKCTIALPFLTHLDISASLWDCALALAHLDLPALTCLRLTTIYHLPNRSDVQQLLPYVARHAHGTQDTQPLRSMLIRGSETKLDLDILAWPVPEIDVEVHDPPTLLGATLPPRMALFFRSRRIHNGHRQVFDMVMAALPLEGLFTLRPTPRWPLLQRVGLTPPVDRGFTKMLLEDYGGSEDPLLPSLTELVFVDTRLAGYLTLTLRDALMKRMLDLRLCEEDSDNAAAVQLFSEFVVDVLGPEETFEARKQVRAMWDSLARGPLIEGPLIEDDEETNSDTDDDDAKNDSETRMGTRL